jgi:hypothetical protein
MPCNFCGHDGVGASGGATGGASAWGRRMGAPADVYCERCGTLLPADESAARFSDKLKLLGRFGLATHTRLLLGTSGEDG